MSIDPTIAVMYAQTGYTARVAHEMATAPQTAVAMAKVMADEMLRHEQTQVQSIEKNGEALITGDREQQSQQRPFGNRRRQRFTPAEPEEDDVSRPPETPLIGNLLNLKV